MTRTPKQARALWATELESGAWRQTDGQLAREVDSGVWEFCCLGVACELAVREGVVETYYAQDGSLDDPVREWLGLADEEGGYGGSHPVSLVVLNDDGVPFTEIAKVIREEPEGLVER